MRAVTVASLVAIAGLCVGPSFATAQTEHRTFGNSVREGSVTETYSRSGPYVVLTIVRSNRSTARPQEDFGSSKDVYYWTTIKGMQPKEYGENAAVKTATDLDYTRPDSHSTIDSLILKNELGGSTEDTCSVFIQGKLREKSVIHLHEVRDAGHHLIGGQKYQWHFTADGEKKIGYSAYDADTKGWKDVAAFEDPTKCDDPKFPFGLM